MTDTTQTAFLALVAATATAFFLVGPEGRGASSYQDAVSAADEIDGHLVSRAPIHEHLPRFRRTAFDMGGYEVTPVARFSVTGLVLGAKTYRWDRASDLSPVDLALGWGRMTDADLLSHLTISQGGRFYRWRYPDRSLVNNSTVIANSSNMHMIPATEEIEDILRSAREGDVVRISGMLVNASHPDGWRWKTSTSRTDTGNGACEIVLVTSIEILGKDARA